MRGLCVVFAKEWKSFLGSDKGVFAVYTFLVVLWSFLFLSTGIEHTPQMHTIWLLMFSVIVGSNFSQGVLVSERINGALEVLLTSGLSRGQILYGKCLFIVVMSIAMGYLCVLLSMIWLAVANAMGGGYSAAVGPGGYVAFAAAAYMNASSAAWLSIHLSNPRMLHFINFVLMACVVALYHTVAFFVPLALPVLILLLVAVGTCFLVLARKGFEGEKIIRPVHL